MKKSSSVDDTFYYRNLSYSYKNRHVAGRPGPYNKSDFDRVFGPTIVGKVPYLLKDKFDSLPEAEMNRIVRATFHLDS